MKTSISYFTTIGISFLLANSLLAQPKKHEQVKLKHNGFYENKGQLVDQNYESNPQVKYLLNTPGFNVQLRRTGFSYDTYTEKVDSTQLALNSQKLKFPKGKKQLIPLIRHYQRIDIELLGCNPHAPIIATGESKTYFNYFTSGTPKGGVSFVHDYEKVTYKNIYPNIDLCFFISQSPQGKARGVHIPVEYNFIVHPGGKVSDIKMQYKGANKVNLKNNKLVVNVQAGNFTENIPSSYLQSNKQQVEVNYIAIGKNTYSFSISQPPPLEGGEALIIDPTPCLEWGTYYGGSNYEDAEDIAVDAGGNAYITGRTYSYYSIATAGAYQTTLAGAQEAFVAKFNPSGASLLWGTYYGGSAAEEGFGIALDVSNNVYITGNTNSTTAISTAGAYQTTLGGGFDAFIAKFNPTGTSLIWATYYGGINDEQANGIALDAGDNVYITGWTDSPYIATAGAYQTIYNGGNDVFVAKFNSSGSSLLWSTYYGGSGDNEPTGISLDVGDSVFITGWTSSSNDIATPGAYQATYGGGSYDAFVAKFNSTGSSLLWGTYYGGSDWDMGFGIAVDAFDTVYITGGTQSINGIATPGVIETTHSGTQIAFLAKLAPNGASRIWGTYFCKGDQENDGCYIKLDECGNIYLSGDTYLTGLFPNGIATTGAYETANSSGAEACFVAKINTTANALLWGSYYGGKGNGSNVVADVWNMALDDSDNVYITGPTQSTADIATASAYQTSYGGAGDVFVAKFGCNPVCTATLKGALTQINITCNGQCNGMAEAYPIGGIPPYTYSWSPSGATTDSISGLCPGTYTCTVVDSVHDTTALAVVITQPPILKDSISKTNATCGNNNGTAIVTASGGTPAYTYSWAPTGSTSATASNLSAGTYTVSVTDRNGCTINDTITIIQSSVSITVKATSADATCGNNNGTAIATASGGTGVLTYSWSPSGGTNSTTSNLSAGTYTVTITDSNGCTATATVLVNNVGSIPADTACCSATITSGQTVTLHVMPGSYGNTYLWQPSYGLSCDTCPNPTASPKITTWYYVTITDSNGCTTIDSLLITVKENCGQIFVPDAFSPNGDGQNDILYVRGICLKDIDFAIYDRWGNKVYESTNLNDGWDGNYKGQPMNNGTYAWFLKATDLNNNLITKKGNVSLVR